MMYYYSGDKNFFCMIIADINEVKVDHHNYINKKVLFALVGTSSLLGIVLLLLSWFWIAKLRKLKKFDSESTQNLGTFSISFQTSIVLVLLFAFMTFLCRC